MDIQELENAAILRGKHLVSFDYGAAKGGALPSGLNIKSDVRDRYKDSRDNGAIQAVTPEGGQSSFFKRCGKDNQAPLKLEEAVRGNSLLLSLLDTKAKLILGQRIYMYYERWENDAEGKMKRIEDEEPMPQEIADFFEASEEHRYFQTLAAQIVTNGNVLTQFLPTENSTLAGQKIAALRAEKQKFWRKEEMDTEGSVQNAFFKGDAWARQGRTSSHSNSFPVKSVPMWTGAKTTDASKPFLYWTGDPMFCFDDYYYSVVFQGALPWAGIMNIVPLFHDANIANKYVTPLHIRIRKGMFLDKKGYEQAIDPAQKQKYLDDEATARKAWLKEVNEVLAGYENAGRTIWSEEEVLSNVQKQFPDVEIVPLDIKMHDDALLSLDDAARKAIISSVQIHPTIANVETAGKLSSGSEMRNAVKMQRIIHAPNPRKNLMEAVKIAVKLNNWHVKYAKNGRAPKFGFADEDIVVLSENKTGSVPVNGDN